ncbi:hypothetical protein LG201_02280 [Methylobacillus gramineus]|uniref:hypothetical protein n=1 Tax=Methylobacillus gramineus TaxID=755169 RepID=UPI001CFF9C0F|nr:hypothetical protein [Methylobacillus gramineus]MCB5184026.1 hypothetical protein [Methylobacillus gramineus]
MKHSFIFILLTISSLAHAESSNESKQQTRERQQVESIRQYDRSGHREPLNTYQDRPMDLAPRPINNDRDENLNQSKPYDKKYDWQQR